MAVCSVIIKLVVALLVVICAVTIYRLLEEPPHVQLEETWWGKGIKSGKEDISIKPFKINISEDILKDLKYRLDNARPFTPPLEGIQQQYGMNTKLLSEIVTHWRTKYDWRSREVFLNQFPQFTTTIQGLSIHYIHVKPTNVPKNIKVLPLLLLHGWPGSVREFYGLIPVLTSVRPDRDFVFEVIAPSLPGYGFSEGAAKPGLGVAQAAVIFKNLMERLKFEKYYMQGGDWGSVVTSNIAILYPDRVLGLHLNMCYVQTPLATIKTILGSIYPPLVISKKYEKRMYPFLEKLMGLIAETGYLHLQATKPDTVGVGLNDSPVGLAAYILEKFSTGTNFANREREDGGLLEKFQYTDLLDNVMIYWVTGSMTTAMRLYAETLNKEQNSLGLMKRRILVPSACARFETEISYQTDWILRDRYVNLVQSTDFDFGGHFAAFEVPQELANDVFSAVDKMRIFNN